MAAGSSAAKPHDEGWAERVSPTSMLPTTLPTQPQ